MRQELSSALTDAVEKGDKRRAHTIRLVCAAIKDRDGAQRAAGRDPLNESEMTELLTKMIRQRIKAAHEFEDEGSEELASKEREEIMVIRDFLPAQMGPGELEEVCRQVVAEEEAKSLRDVGRCMSTLKERYPDQVDLGEASSVVKDLLR